MNAVVQIRAEGAEMWTGSQSPNRAQERAAAVLGLKPEQMKVNVALVAATGKRIRSLPLLPERLRMA